MPVSTGFQVTLAGVDYSSYIDLDSVVITSQVTLMTSTCTFTVMIPDQAVTRPKSGQEVIVTSNLGREFAGHIVTVNAVQNQSVATQLDYQVSCRDYAFLLNRHVAFNEFSGSQSDGRVITYDQIVKTLVNQYAAVDGFTTMNVQPSYDAPYTRFDYQPVSDSISQLAQQIAWAFYVDYFKDVHFYDGTTTLPSPLTNNTLLVDTATTVPDSFGVYPNLGVYGDLKIQEDISQIRTRVFLYGQQVTSSQFISDSAVGDGSTQSFPLTYPPSQDLVSSVVVTVGGTVYIAKVDLVDGAPTSTAQDFTAYINFTQQTVRFNVAPLDGVQVVVQYKPQLPIALAIPSPADAAAIGAIMGNDGYFEYALSDPTLQAETLGPTQARADELLTKYGQPQLTVSFSSYLHGWQSGSFFKLTSSRWFDGQFDGASFYVTKVEKRLVSHPTSAGPTQPLFRSSVTASNNVYVY